MYQRLFTPGRIGKLDVKNRIVMTAHANGLSGMEGKVTSDICEYYAARAKGGVGLIITEMVPVNAVHGRCMANELRGFADDGIPAFQAIADAVHPYGAKIFAQLIHSGSYCDLDVNQELIAPSPLKIKGGVRGLRTEEVYELADDFGRAAHRIQLGGFDGVEIHGAHHYLVHAFLSPLTNHRDDEFGGSLENRARFLKLVIESVRRHCGPDFPLSIRISVEEYMGKDGYHADEGIKICQMAEQWGADMINVSASGNSSKLSQSVEPINFLQGWRKHLAMAVKKCVSIPVCCVALVREPEFAEQLLEQGYTDFVGSARSFLADPEWPNKAREGRECDIRHCISCVSCLDILRSTGRIGCAINPEAGYETMLPEFKADGAGRKVAVLGAGPGGLEAAYVAAKRGFAVTVFEKMDVPGGQAGLAGMIPRKEKMAEYILWLEKRALEAGAQIRYNCAPTLEQLREFAPYAIIEATGAVPLIPDFIEGAHTSPLVVTPPQVIRGEVDIREESVVVVGSGMTGLETAEILCERERNNAVVILEMANRIAPGANGSNRNAVTAVLDINNVVYMLGRKLTKIGEDRIYFTNAATGEEYQYPCDRVVLSVSVTPALPYGEDLHTLCDKVFRIGDANTGNRRIFQAVREGYVVASELE